MFRLSVLLALIITPIASIAGEKVSGTDTFLMNENQWPIAGGTVFWTIQNSGTSQITEGPLEVEAVECHGSGFWSAGNARGEGICIYGAGDDTFVQAWKVQSNGTSEWHIAQAYGKFAGLTGEGKSASRTEGDQRITSWVGEIDLP